MTDDRTKRIRDLNHSIEQWQSEHEHELRELRGSQTDFKSTLKLTSRVVFLGSPPAIVWIICWCLVSTENEPTWIQILVACAGLFLYAVVAAGVARASGMAAYFWFHHSNIQERSAATVMALAGTLFVLWWILELVRW